LAELSDSIVANLKAFQDNDSDLEAMMEETSIITGNLGYIDEADIDDLEALPEETKDIAAKLKS
jgi:hypothetical protein